MIAYAILGLCLLWINTIFGDKRTGPDSWWHQPRRAVRAIWWLTVVMAACAYWLVA